jgi:hypothetical protein
MPPKKVKHPVINEDSSENLTVTHKKSGKNVESSDKESEHSDKDYEHSDKDSDHSDKDSNKDSEHSDKDSDHSDKDSDHSDKDSDGTSDEDEDPNACDSCGDIYGDRMPCSSCIDHLCFECAGEAPVCGNSKCENDFLCTPCANLVYTYTCKECEGPFCFKCLGDDGLCEACQLEHSAKRRKLI